MKISDLMSKRFAVSSEVLARMLGVTLLNRGPVRSIPVAAANKRLPSAGGFGSGNSCAADVFVGQLRAKATHD